jgi:hypothetical protein
MQSALRLETKVLPGNKIEVNLPEGTASPPVGRNVEIIVLLPEQEAFTENQSILKLLELLQQQPRALAKPSVGKNASESRSGV